LASRSFSACSKPFPNVLAAAAADRHPAHRAIHLEAFRTRRLPLVTAILSAHLLSLGIMTLAGIHLDPFTNVTPISSG
jgi:hypothetical protein